MQLKITQINNSLGITFPLEIIDKLNLKEGDIIDVIETTNGINLTPYNAEFERVMQAAESITKRYENALKELAK